jgi:hypothetical protein
MTNLQRKLFARDIASLANDLGRYAEDSDLYHCALSELLRIAQDADERCRAPADPRWATAPF